MRQRVLWDVGKTGGDGIDVTDRTMTIAPITRALSPFLGGYEPVQVYVQIANEDRKFSSRTAGSHLEDGPTFFYGTTVKVQQGFELEDKSIEYVDVFTGIVQYVRHVEDSIEIRAADKLTILQSLQSSELYAIEPMASALIEESVGDALIDFATTLGPLVAGDFDSTSLGWLHASDGMRDAGWQISGTIPQGSNMAAAMAVLARSGLATLILTESGQLDLISEMLPREANSNEAASDQFPDLFDSSNSLGFELVESQPHTVTDLTVEYAGVSYHYRDTADETSTGRLPKTINMPFCRSMMCAAWACRLVYEHHKQFPPMLIWIPPVLGHLVQLNDRCRVKDPMTDTVATYRVVSKSIADGIPILVGARSPSESTIFDTVFATVGTHTWNGSTEML